MFKFIKGRLGLIISLVVLLNACTFSDAFLSAPYQAPPDIDVAPSGDTLECPGTNADVSAALNGWSSSDASLPAYGALRLELKARPTETLTGLFAVGAKAVNAFNEAAIAVRFRSDGTVDARDGAFYSSDVEYAYDPGVWYSISIAADIDAETYDVEIGPCGEPRQTLIKGASFRSDADIAGELAGWAVWASDTASLEISTPAWMPSGGCMPATCDSLGHACGAPSNGCGGALSCGTCGGGQTCESGTCVDAPVVMPPPPACEPATCQSLSVECGTTSNGCGGSLSCGGCGSGASCQSGACVADPAPAPATPSPGDPDRPWADNTGPTNPAALVSSGSKMITTDGAVYENLNVNGDIYIDADNVTIRNFRINAAGGSYAIKVFDGHRGVVIEDGEITGFRSAGILGVGYTASRLHVHTSGGDAFKIQGTGGPTVLQDSFVEKFGLVDGVDHSDAVQSNDSTLTTSNVTIRRNNFYMPYGIGYYPNANFMLQQSLSNWVIENNWLVGGTYTVYCYDYTTQVTVRNNYFGDGALYGPRAPQRPCKQWSGNTWEDTGAPVSPN